MSVSVLTLLALAWRHGSLDIRRTGQDDGLGLGQHQDRRRVLGHLVVELMGDLVPLPDLKLRNVPQPLNDVFSEFFVSGIDASVSTTSNNPSAMDGLNYFSLRCLLR